MRGRGVSELTEWHGGATYADAGLVGTEGVKGGHGGGG